MESSSEVKDEGNVNNDKSPDSCVTMEGRIQDDIEETSEKNTLSIREFKSSEEAPVGSEPASLQQPTFRLQFLGSLMAALTQISVGSALTFSGLTIPELTSANSTDLTLDDDTTALFSSLSNLGGIFGSLMAGFLMVSVGQRVTILFGLPLTLLSWLGVAFANSVPLLLGARFLVGLTTSLLEVTPYTYIAEISYGKYRGALSALTDVTRGLGIIFLFGIGTTSLTWREMALVISLGTTVLPFIGLLFLPDSPRWLASKGYFKKAARSLQFFRGRQYNVSMELADISSQVKDTSQTNMGVLDQFKQFKDPSTTKRFFILGFMTLLWQWGGNSAILSYTTVIFGQTDSCSSPNVCSVMVGVGRTIGAVVFLFTIDHIGRRMGFIIAALGCAIAMFSLGTYFYIRTEMDNGYEIVSVVSWLPLVSVFVFTFFVPSVVAISSILPGEILPLSFRMMGKGLSSVLSYCYSFSSTQAFILLKNSYLGLHGTFWLYAFCSSSSALIPLFLLPETKGKSLEDIEKMYRNNHNLNKRKSIS